MRQTHTPRQRAEEALAVEARRVQRLSVKRAALKAQVDAVSRELAEATARREYLAAHPDLARGATATEATP